MTGRDDIVGKACERLMATIASMHVDTKPTTHEQTLADIRTALHLTQVEMAARIGTTQSGVSRLERQGDMLLSTLRGYAEALGGRLVVAVDHPTETFEVELAGQVEPAMTGIPELGGLTVDQIDEHPFDSRWLAGLIRRRVAEARAARATPPEDDYVDQCPATGPDGVACQVPAPHAGFHAAWVEGGRAYWADDTDDDCLPDSTDDIRDLIRRCASICDQPPWRVLPDELGEIVARLAQLVGESPDVAQAAAANISTLIPKEQPR